MSQSCFQVLNGKLNYSFHSTYLKTSALSLREGGGEGGGDNFL